MFSKPRNRWLIGLGIVAIAITGTMSFYTVSRFGATNHPTPSPRSTSTVKKVAALGRLEPEAEIVRVAAPVELDGDRVAQLFVKQGDRVKVGQVIAVLNSQSRLKDALRQAQQQVQVARARLAQVKAGARTGEIQAQQAAITRVRAERQGEIASQQAIVSRWESEVRNAQAEFDRFQQLYQEGSITASNLDSKRLVLETAQAQLRQAQAKQNQTTEAMQAQLREAKANLTRISEVRPVDVQAAQTEVKTAIAAADRAQTELKQASIRAPITGQILKIHTRAGEKLSDSGIADLAQNDRMVAIAEVYQSDISRVKAGQSAQVTGQAFFGKLQGTVSQVGLQVNQQKVFSNEPGENLDRRVVEVRIRLNPKDSKRVSHLTNLQIKTAILLK